MRAVYVEAFNAKDPASAAVVGERPEPDVPDGWARVHVRAATLNHHDLWNLRGFSLSEKRLPMILGVDAAGVDDDGREVMVHTVISDPSWRGDETLDPRRTLLSELHQGTFADQVIVPTRNLVPKPAGMSMVEAATLPVVWLTAYRMLFTNSGLRPGDAVLVQGAGGGVATALIALARAAGLRVLVATRDMDKADAARRIGAHDVVETGTRLPTKVDAVMETVGAATWRHSVLSLRPGGTIVISGATAGDAPPSAELSRIFFQQLRVIGSTMGTLDEFAALVSFMSDRRIAPLVHSTFEVEQARSALRLLNSGQVVGKIGLTFS